MNSVKLYCKGYTLNNYKVVYDLDKLKNVRKDLIQIKKQAEEMLSNVDNDRQKVKLTLFLRFISKPIQPTKILIGPIHFAYLTSKEYPHKICLLGEDHRINKLPCPLKDYCTSSPDFIVEYTKKSSKFIDIFIEEQFQHKNSHPIDTNTIYGYQDSYMYQALDKFDPSCYLPIKTNCNLVTSRIHAADLRRTFSSDIEEFIFELSANTTYIPVYNKNSPEMRRTINIIKKLLKIITFKINYKINYKTIWGDIV